MRVTAKRDFTWSIKYKTEYFNQGVEYPVEESIARAMVKGGYVDVTDNIASSKAMKSAPENKAIESTEENKGSGSDEETNEEASEVEGQSESEESSEEAPQKKRGRKAKSKK